MPSPAVPVSIDLTVEANLAHASKASPLSLAPDIWWSESRWTIGLTHSNASVDRFEPGGSLCVRTDTLYCDSVYRGGNVDARYQLTPYLAPRARFLIRDVSPFKPAITLGVLHEHQHGRFHFRADPYLQLGLANQDQGNRAAIFLPVELGIEPTCRWLVTLDTGWNSELAVIRDDWHIPVAVGVRADATPHWSVGATVGFATLLGPQNTPKERVLFVGASWKP